jgi:hypothetical protein
MAANLDGFLGRRPASAYTPFQLGIDPVAHWPTKSTDAACRR